jgi:DNA-binding transcriptional MerR regulator
LGLDGQRELGVTHHRLPVASPTTLEEQEENSGMESQTNREDRSVAEVDRIRDIIFGPQMRLYEQNFQRVTSQLEALGNQLEEIRAALQQQAADQESCTRRIQEEVRQALDGQKKELLNRMEQQEAEQQRQMRQLSSDLRKQGQDLQGEFTAALDRLDDDKASRHNLGDLLMEAGMRLKQQMGIVDFLGQLGEAASDDSRR